MAPSLWQILIIAVVVLLLFGGRGKISALMGDFGKGLKSFKDQIKSQDEENQVDELKNKTIKKATKSKKKKDKNKQT